MMMRRYEKEQNLKHALSEELAVSKECCDALWADFAEKRVQETHAWVVFNVIMLRLQKHLVRTMSRTNRYHTEVIFRILGGK
jgi:hypothetical protein